MNAIVAVYSDWGIGDGETQPVVLKADRAHFRSVTAGAAVIVGRKTLEDFPGGKPLKGRDNFIITRQNIEIEGAAVVHSPEEAVEATKDRENVLVIGGASVYMRFFPYLERVYVTKVDAEPESVAFFPNLDRNPHWQCTEQSDWAEEDGVRYCFCIYDRI